MVIAKMIKTEKLPREILEKAVQLRNHHRAIFIALYRLGEPATAQQIAQLVGHKRPYVHMRLLELVDRGLVKTWREGRTAKFEVAK
jgi:DNA-binding MarR family transcriptional regulator